MTEQTKKWGHFQSYALHKWAHPDLKAEMRLIIKSVPDKAKTKRQTIKRQDMKGQSKLGHHDKNGL